MDLQSDSFIDSKSGAKSPVVRGARACTVCRAAKMKCVGAEDGHKPCQRCKRANVECIFEKHRRGRKPGSKLSEASKMLRRLEKGLNTAKLKSHTSEPGMTSPYQSNDARATTSQENPYSGMRSDGSYEAPNTHFPSNELPPLNLAPYQNGDAYAASSNGSRTMDVDEDEDDGDRAGEGLFPAKLIRRENRRNSFFRTILNPEETPASNVPPNRGASFTPPQVRIAPIPAGLEDPITAGLIDEEQAKVLFDLIFLRLNPFVNVFDPALHSVPYVRSKCPFLFTTLIMAGCKFFKPELFKKCQKLANDFAVRAFADAWKRVEVVQAFACLTYWKDPDDNRTWTYIGYACRMAVELGLNRYVPIPPTNETEFQRLERRNRERTYLVLFVHDRSLSTQTGRHWMLPEDDLIRNSTTWHEEGGGSIRPEDVIVAAFVQLRRIAAETTDVFNTSKGVGSPGHHNDVNYEVVLRNCNAKLTQWADTWQREMDRAGGEKFHSSFLSFFRLYVRLFLNSFGIQASMSPTSRASPSLQALSACCTSALDSLRIVSKDFASMSMLRYGQDSITVMSAYSAVFLLKLLRSSNTLAQLNEGTANEIHSLISKTADAYYDASVLSPASTSAAYHARFLRSLVANDIFKSRRNEPEHYESSNMPIDPRLQGPTSSHSTAQNPAPQMYPHQVADSFQFPASPNLPVHPLHQPSEYQADTSMRNGGGGGHAGHIGMTAPPNYQGFAPAVPHHASELDAHYWKNMFLELGFGENVDQTTVASADSRAMSSQYMPSHHNQQHHPQSQHHQQHHPQQQQQQQHQHHNSLPYHHMHSSSQPSYAHPT